MIWVVVGVTVVAVVLIVVIAQTFRGRTSKEAFASAGVVRLSMSAQDVLRHVQDLQETGAPWSEIWQTLNPDRHVESQVLLVELRGRHLFAPNVALNVLQLGCELVIATDPQADRLAALQAALEEDYRL